MTWTAANIERNLALVEKLRGLAAYHQKTVAQLAIAWVLSNLAVTVALCGAKSRAEVTEDIGGDWDIPEALRDQVNELVLSEGVGMGKVGDPGP
jgi:aryl-alcohol dehydrogenase-like predicted oxidoreductase